MTKTITASFAVPDQGKPVRINLADTEGIMVGSTLRIGFDYYSIVQIDELGITAVKASTIIPVGLECWIVDASLSQ
jgi:hypothetical protein